MQAKLTIRQIKALKPATLPYEVVDTELNGFRLRVQPSGVMTYYLVYRTQAGRKKRYRIGRADQVTPAQARDIAEELSAQAVSGVDIQAAKQKARHDAERAKIKTLGGFLEQKYGPWVLSERKTGKETLQRLFTNFGELMERPLQDIDPWIIEKWRAEQRQQGKAVTTINRDIVALKATLSKALAWGLIDHHPLRQLKPIKTDNRRKIRYLSQAEEKRLREALDSRETRLRQERASANTWRLVRGYLQLPDLADRTFVDHLKPMVLVSLNTGLRRGELFSLTWNHVDFHSNVLTIDGDTAKSGKTRHIPLNEEALSVLQAWREQSSHDGIVFPAKDGTRLDNVRKAWAGVLTEASITHFRWHDLRHHFASKLVMAGVDLNTVRELLGHSDLTMTLRYAHLAPEHKAAAVALLMANK